MAAAISSTKTATSHARRKERRGGQNAGAGSALPLTSGHWPNPQPLLRTPGMRGKARRKWCWVLPGRLPWGFGWRIAQLWIRTNNEFAVMIPDDFRIETGELLLISADQRNCAVALPMCCPGRHCFPCNKLTPRRLAKLHLRNLAVALAGLPTFPMAAGTNVH